MKNYSRSRATATFKCKQLLVASQHCGFAALCSGKQVYPFMGRQSAHTHEKEIGPKLVARQANGYGLVRVALAAWSGLLWVDHFVGFFVPFSRRATGQIDLGNTHGSAPLFERSAMAICMPPRQWLFCVYLISCRLSLTSILQLLFSRSRRSARLLLACMQRRRQSENLWRAFG
jgi:hypothetical protein